MFKNVPHNQTDYVLVPAVAGKRIRVNQFLIMAGAADTSFTFNSKGSGAGVAISPLFPCAANGGAVGPHSPAGWFETGEGEALTCTTSNSGVNVGVLVGYTLEDVLA
jgi:hypothetical protein